MKRPWQIWSAFGVCLLVVLLGMAWLTYRAVALDRAEAHARRDAEQARSRAELQERVALALWRMDWTLAPLIAQEITRPSYTYRPFLAAKDAKASQGRRAELASPLLTQPSRFVVLNFDVAEGGAWMSPQSPSQVDVPDAVAAGVSPDTLVSNGMRLDELRNSVTFEQLLAQLPDTLLPPTDAHGSLGYYANRPPPRDQNVGLDDASLPAAPQQSAPPISGEPPPAASSTPLPEMSPVQSAQIEDHVGQQSVPQ